MSCLMVSMLRRTNSISFTMVLKLKQMVTHSLTLSCVVPTMKNGQNIVNYHYEDLVKALDKYSAFNLENPFILVDTNHDNSGKNFMEQVRIVREVLLNREWDGAYRGYRAWLYD